MHKREREKGQSTQKGTDNKKQRLRKKNAIKEEDRGGKGCAIKHSGEKKDISAKSKGPENSLGEKKSCRRKRGESPQKEGI